METGKKINIPGINTEAAIKQCGSYEMYMELLADVYGIIDKKCKETEQYLADADVKNFTVVVHSLKTTCRMLGYTSLSDSFLELENYGKERDLDKAIQQTPEVLSRFLSLKTLLAPFVEKEQNEKVPFSSEEIGALLSQIEEATADFDVSSAESAIKKLLTYKCDKELSDKLNELSNLVNELDYDEAKELAASIKQTF